MSVPYTIKYTNIESTDAIENYLEDHLAKLDAVVDDNDKSAQASIELAKTVADQHSGNIYKAEVNLHTAKGNFYVSETSSDIYAAIDLMRDVIVRDVKKAMEKLRDQGREGARVIKDMLREE